ncbi:hypothetical protein PoB_002004300 [Plakobranchus ocellatus]|uniref:Uncharacterized protein n=1 Tax=Plakobranchus ocellatus TaxID=259542 RepID=A0AAV3ZG18_9GAST|nr:hypothetical protein PoB_002004300 [Plakobranchus ocellatus]
MTNVALDTSYDSNSPPRYANSDPEPSNGPPGYATDEDSRRARYNRGYAPDDAAPDQGDAEESRGNYSRRRRDRERGDRPSRGSRSRDYPDNPRSQSSYDYDDNYRQDDPPRADHYGADDGTDGYAPDNRYTNMPPEGFGDPNIGTAI